MAKYTKGLVVLTAFRHGKAKDKVGYYGRLVGASERRLQSIFYNKTQVRKWIRSLEAEAKTTKA